MRISLFLALLFLLNGCAYYFGNSWQKSFEKIPKTKYPSYRESPNPISAEDLSNHPIVIHFANKKLVRPTKKDQRGPERLVLAKLAAKQDIAEANEYLLNTVPWGNSGTSGDLNPKGDYDFTTVILAAILYKFQDDTTILWPQTAKHIGEVLLVEEGGKPHKKTPRTMGIMRDTENHILMTNISQYLKNQWMVENGNTDLKYNNLENGLEEFLLANLEELQTTGQYEFNSKPYEGYTISALLILQSYCASKELKAKATETLNQMCWEYTLTSSDFRKSAPFRRRMARQKNTSLTDNPSSAMMKAWFLEHKKGVFAKNEIEHNHHQALSALAYDYRPPIEVWNENNSERLIKIGHGKTSSPEIHSRGEEFLLSAGGFHRGAPSQLVTRPIVLMLNDGETDHLNCFHINGKGKWQKWNNTGVHHRFAVGNIPVHVPSKYVPVDTLGNWKLFYPNESGFVVTYSEKGLGLIYLQNEDAALSELAELNPDPSSGVFYKSENSEIRFNVKAKKGTWVIESVNGKAVNTKTDKWPRVKVVEF